MVVSDRIESAPGSSKRSSRKRLAILDAATEVFLRDGYLGTSMDEIATLSSVSKQTVYKHFSSKEALFVEIVSSLTDRTGDAVHAEMPPMQEAGDVATYLEAYGYRQLSIVLTPRIMQLRRLVIGEVSRFPDLARVLYERGPQRAMGELADLFSQLAADGLLAVKDPAMAAVHFNWLVMAQALNQAMLLGDDAIPTPAEQRRAVKEGLAVFLAAYGVKR
ncbi:MAG: TetR/AcrR family transcriptional regulator [Rhizobiaceae bacterium]|nr:TetR/AcrR family transcriptional regulator [Rhizobiaceae bacterium]